MLLVAKVILEESHCMLVCRRNGEREPGAFTAPSRPEIAVQNKHLVKCIEQQEAAAPMQSQYPIEPYTVGSGDTAPIPAPAAGLRGNVFITYTYTQGCMMRNRSCHLFKLNTMKWKSVFKREYENCTKKLI